MSRPYPAAPGAPWRPAPRLREGSWRALGVLCLVLLSVALGRDVAAWDGDQEMGGVLLGVAAALACAVIVAIGPVACLAAIGGLAAAGLLPVLSRAGGVDLTLADLFYVGVVGGWALQSLRDRASAAMARPAPSPVPQLPALLFLAFAGLTLWHVRAVDPGEFGDSLVSWLRLVQTASLAWLAAATIRTKRDLSVVLGAVAVGGVVAVALALEAAVSSGGNPLVERYAASLNANALGLVSGLLLVLAMFAGVSRRAGPRLLLGAAGAVGLFLAKSVGAFVATGLAVAVGASLTGRGGQLQRASRGLVAVAIAAVVVFGLVQFLRPTSAPTDSGFRESSASQRIIVGAAGLEVFVRNPVIGAGWRRSDSPAVIGDPEIASVLRARFPDAKHDFFPDVNPTSVHNAYVQILADLGLVGFALFAAALASIGLGVARVLRRVRGTAVWPHAWCASLGLILIMLWLNDNPLYGGQVETIILALLVGLLAAAGRRPPRAEAPAR